MSNGEGGKGKKPKKDPRKPDIPDTAPVDLIDFVDCKGATVTLKKGKAKWLPKLPEVDVSFEEGTEAGSITITVAYGFVSVSIPASVKDGQLSVDTGKFPNVPPFSGAKKATQEWVDKFNAWLKLNGHKLDPPTLKDGNVTLAKSALAAGAPAKAAAAPKAEEPAKGGIKAAAGTGAALLGLGLGTLLAPGDEIATTVPDDPVPIVQVEQMPVAEPEPESEEIVSLPSGQIPAEITVTPEQGGQSFSFPATFQQNGTKLVILAPPNPPFKGTIQGNGAFAVDNQVGSFEGVIDEAQVAGNHIFQGVPFTFEGTLAQPAAVETITVEGETIEEQPQTFTGVIGDGLIFSAPVDDEDGANLPLAGAGLLLAGGGAGLLLLGGKKSCDEQQLVLRIALGEYRDRLAEAKAAQAALAAAEAAADAAKESLDRSLPPGWTYDSDRPNDLVYFSPLKPEARTAKAVGSMFGQDLLPEKERGEYNEALMAVRERTGQAERALDDTYLARDEAESAEQALAECEGRPPRDIKELISEQPSAEAAPQPFLDGSTEEVM